MGDRNTGPSASRSSRSSWDGTAVVRVLAGITGVRPRLRRVQRLDMRRRGTDEQITQPLRLDQLAEFEVRAYTTSTGIGDGSTRILDTLNSTTVD